MLRRLLDKLKTIKVSLMLIVLICWLLPTLILGGYIGFRVFASLKQKTEAVVLAHAEHVYTLVQSNLDSLVTLARAATYDGELSAAVKDMKAGMLTYPAYYKAVKEYLERKYSREPLCEFALFFRPEAPGELLYTSQADQAAAWFAENVQASVLQLGDTLDTRCSFFTQEGRTYLIRNLYNTRLERCGMLVLGIRMETLFAPALAGGMNGTVHYAFSLDGFTRGELIHQAQDGLDETRGTLLYTKWLSGEDYTLCLQSQGERRQLYGEMYAFSRLMVWMLTLLIPLCIGVMVFVRFRIVRPIGILSEAARRMQEGELGIQVPLQNGGELGRLGFAFSEMSLRLKQLIDKSYKEQIALRDARIQAMQSRINPHFLNNALESINWQARMDGAETVGKMVETLSVLLNASIDRNERHLVPLSEELRIADAYFYFVGLRFGARLSIEKRVGAELDEAQVPRLIIQVLVENAVEHGVSPAGGGHILLEVFRRETQLCIRVHNDGKTLTGDDVRRIQALLHSDGPEEGHVGIRNVNQRLKLLFPGRAGLDIGLDAQGNTLAAAEMPYASGKNGQGE